MKDISHKSCPVNIETFMNSLLNEYYVCDDAEKLAERKQAHWETLVLSEEDGYLRYELQENKTGRLYTKKPNLQGLPKVCRKAIQSSGKYIVWADWVASHPNLLAKLSGDSVLLQDLKIDPYSVFNQFDRKTVKLALLLSLNGASTKAISETCGLSSIVASKLVKAMKNRWSVAYDCIDSWIAQAKNGGVINVQNWTIEMGDEPAYKAPAFVLQKIEAAYMKKVCATKIDGATCILPVHDEIVWECEPQHIQQVLTDIHNAMREYGKCSIKYGSAWKVEDNKPAPVFENNQMVKSRLYYDFYPDTVLKESDLINGKYLPPIDLGFERKTIFLKSPKGTGKTSVFKDAIKNCKYGNIISIVPIRSLAKEQSKKIPLPHYKDDYKGDITGSAVVVINSIKRVNIETKGLNILFLDEITSTLASLNHQGTIKDAEVVDIFSYFCYLVQEAHIVVCADADLNGDAVDFINKLRKSAKIEKIVVETKRADDRILYKSDTQLKKKIIEDLSKGQKIYICSTSKKEVKILDEMIKRELPNKKGIMLHSTSEEREEIIAQINQIITKDQPDYIIASPSVQSGVSIDCVDYFDYCCGFYHSRVFSASIFDQMLARVRKPKDFCAHVWLDKRSYQGSIDATEILQNIYNKVQKNAYAMGFLARAGRPEKLTFSDQGWSYVEDVEAIQYNKHFATLLSWQHRKGKLCALNGYEEYLMAHGIKIKYAGDDDNLDYVKDLKSLSTEKIKEQDFEDIMKADDISMELALSFLASEPTPEEQNQINRAFIKDTYGDVNNTTIELYDSGKGRKGIKNLVQAIDVMKGGDALIEKDLKEHEQNLASTILSNNTLKIAMYAELMEQFGVLNRNGEFNFDVIQTQRAQEFIVKHRELIEMSGFQISNTVLNQPIRILSMVLEKVGLKLDKKKRKVKGKTIREYWLCPKHTGFIKSTPLFFVQTRYYQNLQDNLQQDTELSMTKLIANGCI